jgi:hypothetical protein
MDYRPINRQSTARHFFENDLLFGFIIGAGGLNEWSAIAMVAWSSMNFKNAFLINKRVSNWQDFVIIAIGMLCIMFWSFNQIPGDTSGLTKTELIKSLIWVLFAMTCLRTKADKFILVTNGIAIGLFAYALLMTTGSIIHQPFQGARGQLYNIFSGQEDASSSITGYTISSAALILFATKNPMALPAAATGVVLGIQSLNRISMTTGTIIIMFIIVSFGIRAAFKTWLKTFYAITFVMALVGIGYAKFGHSLGSIDIFSRFTELLTTEPRLFMYSAGYQALAESIGTGNLKALSEVNETIRIYYPSWGWTSGWHSVPLDSAMGAGWVGLLLSLIWISGLAIATIRNQTRKTVRMTILGVSEILILLTSMPVALGHYELLGALSVTVLIIYNSPKHNFI